MTVEDGAHSRTRHGPALLDRRQASNCRIRVVYKMRDFTIIPESSFASPRTTRGMDARPLRLRIQMTTTRNVQRRRISHHRHALFADKPLAKPGKPGPNEHHGHHSRRPAHTPLCSTMSPSPTTRRPPSRSGIQLRAAACARPNEGYIGRKNHSDNDIVFSGVSVQPLK